MEAFGGAFCMIGELLRGLLVAVASKVLADEAKEWMAWLPNKLICWAAGQFRSNFRDRIKEEWLAHSNDLPGNLAKLWHGLGCLVTAIRLTGIVSKSLFQVTLLPIVELLSAFTFVFVMLPIYALEFDWILDLSSENARTARLRGAAGGMDVLGLNQLELLPSDEDPFRRHSLTMKRHREILGMLGIAIEKSVNRYKTLIERLFGRGA